MDEMKTGPTGHYDEKVIAENFDKRATTEAGINKARIMGIFLKKFSNITRQSLCLSVGCGTGAKEQFITSDNLVCFDLASEMLKIATQKGYTCVQGTVFSMPFPSNTFDCVFAIDLSTLHYTEDMVNNTIKEMARVTKSGGTVLTMTSNAFRKKVIQFIRYRNPNYDSYMVKNSVIKKAFRNHGLRITHQVNIWSPKVHSLRANMTLMKLRLDFLGSPFVCSGTKTGGEIYSACGT